MKNAYTKTEQEVLAELSVDKESGLSETEAKDRLTKYGENKLEEKAGKSVCRFVYRFGRMVRGRHYYGDCGLKCGARYLSGK